ncbi:hypothetical protein HDV06_004539 [Boothiomyces sp. JEL0866]|nr:hypothetical protein HDV06_004539 [Boothiomyces sp. JEL0866]
MNLEAYLKNSTSEFVKLHEIIHPKIKSDHLQSFILNLLGFQIDHSSKIPCRLFWDLKKEGPVHLILQTAASQFKSFTGDWLWKNTSKITECLSFISVCLEKLQENGLWTIPRIYLSSSISFSKRDEYSDMLDRLGGKVEAKYSSETTHVLQEMTEIADMEDYFRVIQKRDGFAQLHYWYKPDNEDIWVEDRENTYEISKNEEDYELEESMAEELKDSLEVGLQSDDDGDYVNDNTNLSDKDSPLQTGPNSVEDLDETQEFMEEVASKSGPTPWPIAHPVNLDRKLPLKFKRHEFEPIKDGVIGNLSNIEYVNYTTGGSSSIKMEEDELVSLHFAQYGFHAYEDYQHIKPILDEKYKSNPESMITLEFLRFISPSTDIVVLDAILRLLEKQKVINTNPNFQDKEMYTLLKENSEDHDTKLIFKLADSFSESKRFVCSTCNNSCMNHYYFNERDNFTTCVVCFETGQYPISMSSKDFRNYQSFDSIHKSNDSAMWKDEEVLAMLNYIEQGTEWNVIAQKLQKKEEECIMKFIELPTSLDDTINADNTEVLLHQLIGKEQNPVMALISLFTKAVHPGIAAEVAKTSLKCLLKSPQNINDIQSNTVAAAQGLKAAMDKAKQIVDLENANVDRKIIELIQTHFKRIDCKCEILKLLHTKESVQNKQIESSMIAKMYEESKQI